MKSPAQVILQGIKHLVPKNSAVYTRLYLFYMRLQSIRRLKRKKALSFAVHLADHCNLNCKGCDNFSPLADAVFLDTTRYKRDCERLAVLTSGDAEEIQLLGGEPLLHPEVTDIMALTRMYFQHSVIKIVTNGILLKKQPELFWQTCEKNNIQIVITKYPISLPFDEIMQLAKSHHAECGYYGDTDAYLKTLSRRPLDIHGTQNAAASFRLCHAANSCIYLDDGKLYTCAAIPYIKYFNKVFSQNLEVSEKDYIDIYKAKNIGEITDFLSRPIPFCRYCDIKKTVHGIPWEVSKRNISEWV